MQGIYIAGRRPKSKKEVKAAVIGGEHVSLEATSIFGNEYGGPLSGAPDGVYYFVGPDPSRNRKFYGQIIINDGKVEVK